MLNQLKEAYNKIDIEDKRNELNKEISSLLMLINISGNSYNYKKNSNVTEDEFLTETYMQIIELRSNIIRLLRTK